MKSDVRGSVDDCCLVWLVDEALATNVLDDSCCLADGPLATDDAAWLGARVTAVDDDCWLLFVGTRRCCCRVCPCLAVATLLPLIPVRRRLVTTVISSSEELVLLAWDTASTSMADKLFLSVVLRTNGLLG